ncbi:ankyrin repeat protein [Colletotrichum truncatum]|uniref:Ankyrin repeat protein n=1 Tax=Colletotrichum truncatum TaxID=5467 RepID=A0ACC3Z9C9_COLTU|nr:ankyrin repeat protein [Colletotrichum truncatum]KAF6793589.1 ankyrin repeat protein [Colletotrichum truncatum]
MTTAGAAIGASPLPPAPGMSATVDFNEYLDYDEEGFGASSPLPNFDLSNPDTLKLFESSQSIHETKVLEPQTTLLANSTVAAASPDSLVDSFRDSSSDSASSKRTGSSASGKTGLTVGDVMMTDGADIKPDWDSSAAFVGRPEDSVFLFGANTDATLPDGLDLNDDKFMDESFDFESASSSPNTAAAVNMESPEMPTIHANGPQKAPALNNTRTAAHGKRSSQYSISQPMNGLKMTNSRECSPMSQNMITSHEASPSAFFTSSPSPSAPPDFSNATMNAMNPNGFWPAKLDPTAHQMVHNMSLQPQFHSHDGLPVTMPQQMPIFTQPNYEFLNRGCRLTIHPTPTKSRVETQIPIKMTLFPLPPGIKRLHLPTHTISKPKLLAKPPAERSPDTLELYTMLVCTSAMQNDDNKRKAFQRAAAATHSPVMNARSASDDDDEENKPQNGGEVRICAGCITRERKRAARKKIKKVEEEEMWNRDETRRVIVFNTQEIKEWQTPNGVVSDSTVTGRPEPVAPPGAMQVDAPMRIACYCRHHAEKLGFQVIFTIKDWQDRVVAQEMSQSIMITDDHKTHPIPQQLNPPATQSSENNLVPMMSTPLDTSPLNSGGAPFRLSHSSSDLQSLHRNAAPAPSFPVSNPPNKIPAPTPPTTAARSLSRPPSPSSHSGPITKKRKASGSRVPIGMAMTRLDTTPPPSQMPGNPIPSAPSASTSPFTPNLTSFHTPPDAVFQNGAASGMPQPFATGPPTPNSNDQTMFTNANRSASMENVAMPMFSAPASAHQSRAPSPNRLPNGVNAVSQNQFNAMSYLPTNVAPARPQPTIHKIIPNEGPKSGGIEVTILGASFYQGLEVLFGDQKATTTTFWGESSLVCLLPPSPVSGPVVVTFKQSQTQTGQPFPALSKQNQMFKYVDDDEEKLIRTALSILGHKMSGQMVDVKELAQRIIGQGDSSWGAAGPSGNAGAFGGSTFNMSTESQLLKCLELIDLDDNPRMSRLDLRRSTGQTMLHMGCALGYHRFVAGLLARGANPDLRDKGGFTPMHLAALNDHESIVRRLMQAGADPTIRSLSGLRPADVARSRKVIEHIRRCERHIRSRSGGSLHSRASSAASLRSLWDPLGMSSESESIDDGEESPEYSSGDFEDEEEEEDTWLDMRRRSSGHAFTPRPDRQALQRGHDEVQPGLASPTTAIASAVRDQFAAQIQQFQQAMTMHFNNLPQMPALPRMPMLPDYQAYLQQNPLMGRVTSLMPGMSGSRPGSADDENPRQMDGRWWDLSSFRNNNNNSAPPPAYDEIFPQEELDRKQAAALGAAADAAADIKCASLYDTQTTETVEASSSTAPVPSVLKIGRKSAITKEQQQNFLRAREAKFKGMRSDKNLWFIWIPLLTCILGAMLYSRFPQYFTMAFAMLRSVMKLDQVPNTVRNVQDRVVEVL